jgi:chromosome segregation ATPase
MDSYDGVNNKEQMQEHYRFLMSILQTITLADYLATGHEQHVLSPEYVKMKKEYFQMKRSLETTDKEYSSIKTKYDSVNRLYQKHLEQTDKKELIESIEADRDDERRRANSAEKKCSDLENEILYWKNRFKNIDYEYQERFETQQREYSRKSQETDERLMNLLKDKDRVEKKAEKINNKVKAEAEKLIKKKKEKKKEEKKKIKKQMKLAKAKAKALSSDSDSDSSDSDSDSSDSDSDSD